MSDVWSSLSIELQSKRSLGVAWDRRVPALSAAKRAGQSRYYFFPSLNVGLRRLDRGSLEFLHAHFLTSRSPRRRWFWKTMLAMGRFWPRTVPAILSADLEGDVVSLGHSVVEFDLQRGICRKHYRPGGGDYLRRSAEVLEGVSEELLVERAGESICVTTPIWEGGPLPAGASAEARWNVYSEAFRQLGEMQQQHALSRSLGAYAEGLWADAPAMLKQHPLAVRLLDELRPLEQPIVVSLTHGDFKDDNLLCSRGGVRIIDWELADLRSAGHDVFNLLIHPAMHDGLSNESIQKRLGSELWARVEAQLSHLEGRGGLPHELPNLLKLALLEKGILLLQSGRWPGLEQQCLRDWETAAKRLDSLLNLGIFP